MNIVKNAEKIAREAHKHQFRKWGNRDPYIVHPERVANKVAQLDGANEEDVAAAWLHDVIEDIALPENKLEEYSDLIREECGETVLSLVMDLTSPSEWPGWEGKPRVEKRKADWAHLRQAHDRAKRIKMVDRWDNLMDPSVMPGSNYRKKYVNESYDLLAICRHVDEDMAAELEERIKKAEKL